MKELGYRKDLLPNITRPDSGLVLMSEWKVDGVDQQRMAVDVAMEVWNRFPLPEGMLSYNCYLGTDHQTILHYSQWKDEKSWLQFTENDPPERLKQINETVQIERVSIDKFRLYRSLVSDNQAVPGCIVIVREAFEQAETTLKWIDTVFEALTSEEKPEGGISGYFHISTDGMKMVNYAEWTSEKAHQAALDRSGKGVIGLSPVWQKVLEFPGRKNSGSVKRFHFYRSISK